MAYRDPRLETLTTRKRRLTTRNDLTTTLRMDLMGIVRFAIPNYELTDERGVVELWVEVVVNAFGDSLTKGREQPDALEFIGAPWRNAEVLDTLGINHDWLVKRTRHLRQRRDALLRCPHKAPPCLQYVETKVKIDTSKLPKGLKAEW